jgi:hypothetical protein
MDHKTCTGKKCRRLLLNSNFADYVNIFMDQRDYDAIPLFKMLYFFRDTELLAE